MAEEIFDSDTEVYGEIYVIENDVNDKLYVGQTTKTIEERFKGHCRADSFIGKAIRKYGAEHFHIRSLEKCHSCEQQNEREIFWIAALNSKAPRGYNLTGGGLGHLGFSPTKETRAKMSAAGKGRKLSAESRANIAAAKIGNKYGIGNKSRTGQVFSAEERAKKSEAHKGSKRSTETRAKISAANKGRKRTAEMRARISAINKGRKHTAESRAHMSAAQKARWAKRREQRDK